MTQDLINRKINQVWGPEDEKRMNKKVLTEMICVKGGHINILYLKKIFLLIKICQRNFNNLRNYKILIF